MPKQATLRRVREDIRQGDLGRARDRMQGLIATYPQDLSLRPDLAEIYWQLRHPSMAGLYWYLEPEQTEEIQTAIAAFERECGGDPWIMLRRLKIRWDPDEMPEGFAKQRISELTEASRTKHGIVPVFSQSGTQSAHTSASRRNGLLLRIGCALVTLTIVSLSILGVVQIAGWFL
jgi:hypothetical protein